MGINCNKIIYYEKIITIPVFECIFICEEIGNSIQ